MHLDTVCTMVDRDARGDVPADRRHAGGLPSTDDGDGGARVAGPEPFLPAAARAMGIDELRVIDTGLDPVTAEREQWDDGNNTLALAPGLVVAYERNRETNARLEAAGIEVLAIAGHGARHRPRRAALHVVSRRAGRVTLRPSGE